ncbi:MAG: exodeoxyribonuclease VII large subunit [Gammaproteobacteria bacterium RIFCSPHIGHO2_12_FULL_37_34]|nr:MAG: exodeoxyribonuclease VII large subunit [Gammaproteobacteria bacterium RIFCSPHIGHO2_12_FULL_37_34]
MQTIHPKQAESIYTVSRLNSEVRFLLEGTYPFIWIEGEISNFAAPNSGHWYFSLKDASAQVRCAMFRGNQRKLNFLPKDGLHILVRARISLYENRGEFQLIVDHIEERGEGKLRRAFEILKKKLETAGLFDATHKKPLPHYPKQIGLITSSTGAAIRDILTVLKRRYSCVPIIIYPTLVQGTHAAPAIVNAIQTANRRQECDVLILARGGGSLEDLWPFNEEVVAYAIDQSMIPIITGIGHEVDFTIADFVADQRAPTPSAAAEIATPEQTELLHILNRNQQHFLQRMKQLFSTRKQHISWINKHLHQQHPKRRLTEYAQRLDFCEMTCRQLQQNLINTLHSYTNDLNLRLHHYNPRYTLNKLHHQTHLFRHQLNQFVLAHLNKERERLTQFAASLNALSPLATLERGYAIATKKQCILRDITQVEKGDAINIQLTNGKLHCLVEKIDST